MDLVEPTEDPEMDPAEDMEANDESDPRRLTFLILLFLLGGPVCALLLTTLKTLGDALVKLLLLSLPFVLVVVVVTRRFLVGV